MAYITAGHWVEDPVGPSPARYDADFEAMAREAAARLRIRLAGGGEKPVKILIPRNYVHGDTMP